MSSGTMKKIRTPNQLADKLREMRPAKGSYAIVIQPIFSCEVNNLKYDTLQCVVFDTDEAMEISEFFDKLLEKRKAKPKAKESEVSNAQIS